MFFSFLKKLSSKFFYWKNFRFFQFWKFHNMSQEKILSSFEIFPKNSFFGLFQKIKFDIFNWKNFLFLQFWNFQKISSELFCGDQRPSGKILISFWDISKHHVFLAFPNTRPSFRPSVHQYKTVFRRRRNCSIQRGPLGDHLKDDPAKKKNSETV